MKREIEPNYEGMARAVLADAEESMKYYEEYMHGHIVTRPPYLLSRGDAELILRHARTHRLIDADEEAFHRSIGGSR